MPHEMGTDEYLKYLQSETPGELETSYRRCRQVYQRSKKLTMRKRNNTLHMSFDNLSKLSLQRTV